jgi:hypothetical protein
MHRICLALLLAATPASAAKKPPPLPPLPPLVLDAAAPIVTVTIDGQPLRLRVDSGTSRHVEINASAAKRLDLANPARLVGGRPVDLGRTATSVGKVTVRAVTSDELVGYQGRVLPLALAWSDRDPVTGADGQIGPWLLPHDSIRIVRRSVTATDRTTSLPMRLSSGRGLLSEVPVGRDSIDVLVSPGADETIATAAAASILAAPYGGELRGKPREAVIAQGVVRPVRDVVFARPVDIAGIRFTRVAARVFDWSGKTSIPDADIGPDEAVVAGRAGAQSEWPKLAIGNDHLAACAEVAWTRVPPTIDLVCPALP